MALSYHRHAHLSALFSSRAQRVFRHGIYLLALCALMPSFAQADYGEVGVPISKVYCPWVTSFSFNLRFSNPEDAQAYCLSQLQKYTVGACAPKPYAIDNPGAFCDAVVKVPYSSDRTYLTYLFNPGKFFKYVTINGMPKQISCAPDEDPDCTNAYQTYSYNMYYTFGYIPTYDCGQPAYTFDNQNSAHQAATDALNRGTSDDCTLSNLQHLYYYSTKTGAYTLTATKPNTHTETIIYEYPLCTKGKAVTAPVAELHFDHCYKGCKVTNLSPTISDEWTPTLQGTTTGTSCTDFTPQQSDVNTDKMLACGTAGSSDYQTRTDHPIDFAIGNKFFRDTDYRGTGNFPIIFTRTYNSLALGWRFNYTQRIDSLGLDKVAVRRPGGQSYEFVLVNGMWQSDPDVTDRLEALSDEGGNFAGWRYTPSGNKQALFDKSGKLTALRNRTGLTQTLRYSADGRAITITAPEGDTLQLQLAANRLTVESITDKNGRTTSYDFDGVVLKQVNYPNGTHKQYRYEKPDRPWLITGIIDENGHRSHTVDYDAQGRAIMSELADGAERVDISYNSDGTTTLTNALGKKTRFHFQTLHGVRKIVKVEGEPTTTCQGTAMAYRFDDNGFLTEKTDAEGNITQYTRDANGLALSQTEAKGKAEEKTTTTEWDGNLRKPLLITRATSQTRYTYDDVGRTLSRTLINRQTGKEQTTTYGYNARGLLETVNGPREDVQDITTYRYDEEGRLSQVTNALGHTTKIVGRDSDGRPLTTEDANGRQTTLTYDEKGRIQSRTIGSQITTLAYDAVGNLTKVTSPDGTYLNYRYDNANRLIAIEDKHGNTINYTLDALGHKTSEKVMDTSGNLVRLQQKTYDELGRLLTSVGAQDQTTSYGYDRNNNLIRTIDPLWQLHENSYDGLNRLIEQTDPNGNTTDYVYDNEDRLIQITDPNGNATTYDYDGLGNLTAQHSPDTGSTTYTHDSAGNVLTRLDANGNTTHYQYDALNRLIKTTYADGTGALYSYDNCPYGIGRLCTLTDSSGSTSWEYDRLGHTTLRRQNITLEDRTTTLTTQYRYNSTGQLAGIIYPSGMSVGYDYADGKISGINIDNDALLSAITYQPFGSITGWTWANGSTSQRGYDLDGRLINQKLGSTARTLDYDVNGNITAITEPDNSQTFGYDSLNRLITANDSSFNLAWDYDANGNRLSETSAGLQTAYTIETTSNRLLAVGDTAYQYDLNGNLINDGEHSYQYNAQNRLATVDDGAIAVYRYNALGQRIYKKGVALPCDVNSDGKITHEDLKLVTGKDKTTIDAEGPGKGNVKGKGQSIACIATQQNNGQGKGKESQIGSSQLLFSYDDYRLLGEYDTQGNATQETIWLGNLPVTTVQNGSTYYIHTDHLGTPRVITNSSNTEVWRWDNDPFGVAAANEDPDGDGQVFNYKLRFSGQYYDEETGKHYNYFRGYDPATGRYIESDPIGLDGGLNTFAYVGNNPQVYVDPYGLIDLEGAWKHCQKECGARGQIVKRPIILDTPVVELWRCECVDGCYENPGHHDPKGGPNRYNPTKETLPENHEDLWRQSRPDPRSHEADYTRWTKEGTGKYTNWHRFSNDRNGNWHWSGSTKGGPDGFGNWRSLRSNDLPKGLSEMWK